MPSEGRRLHGFSVVSRALTLARQLLLPAILGGASAGDDLSTTLQWIAIILAIPSLALAFAQWLLFRYRLDADELIIHSGVLSRRRRVIPVARIQNVDLAQSPLDRLAGVAKLRMETASGGGETEASLSVLSVEEARRFQAEILRRRAAAGAEEKGTGDGGGPDAGTTALAGDRGENGGMESAATAGAALGRPGAAPEGARPEAAAAGSPPRRLLRLSVADLAIAGATSNEAGLIAAGLATGLELADDLGGLEQVEAWIQGAFERGASLGLVGALAVGAGLALGVLVLGWLLSVVVSVIRYHGFTLTRIDDDLRREYGLFSRHHSTVPLERVQAVRIEESLLRRPLGLVALKIETAGARPREGRRSGGEAEAFVPIARRREVGRLLREVFPDARLEGTELNPVSPLSRRRSFLRLAVPIALAATAAGLLVAPRWSALLLLWIPAWLYARAEFRARGWGRPEAYVLVRGGVFTRVSWVVPERKIQTLHVVETPFQRRLDLATLLVDTAAGTRVARVADLERPTAAGLLDRLARDAEAARKRAAPRRPPGG